MNSLALDAIKLLLDMQQLDAVSAETKTEAMQMVGKLLRWMHSDIDAVIEKTSRLLNPQ